MRLPYSALNARQPSRSPMPTATSTLSRNSPLRAGHDTRPRSPPGMSPAAKLSPMSCTPASVTAATNSSISASAGTATGQGHQNSTASKPACLAAAGRSSRGSSVKRIEQLTAYTFNLSVMRNNLFRSTITKRPGRPPPTSRVYLPGRPGRRPWPARRRRRSAWPSDPVERAVGLRAAPTRRRTGGPRRGRRRRAGPTPPPRPGGQPEQVRGRQREALQRLHEVRLQALPEQGEAGARTDVGAQRHPHPPLDVAAQWEQPAAQRAVARRAVRDARPRRRQDVELGVRGVHGVRQHAAAPEQLVAVVGVDVVRALREQLRHRGDLGRVLVDVRGEQGALDVAEQRRAALQHPRVVASEKRGVTA